MTKPEGHIEQLYQFPVPTTEVEIAVLNLGWCVDVLANTSAHTLRQARIQDCNGNPISVARALRIVCREFQDILFRLDLGENDAA